MICCFPTVTWPSHTTMATGVPPARHGVIGNNYLDRQTGKPVTLLCDPVFAKDQVVKCPTIYDVAQAAGLKTAAICWPATRNCADARLDRAGHAGRRLGPLGNAVLADRAARDRPPRRLPGAVVHPAGRRRRTRLALHADGHPDAREAMPNLLMIHLVEPDHVQHRAGPRSPDAYWCASYADDRVRDLVEAIARSPRAGKTTLIVCSDHGFFPVHNTIQPNVLLRQLGFLEASGKQVGKKSAYCLSQGGACAVYVLDDARRAEITSKLRKALGGLEGVTAVLGPERFAALGQPTREEDSRAPDLWLAAARLQLWRGLGGRKNGSAVGRADRHARLFARPARHAGHVHCLGARRPARHRLGQDPRDGDCREDRRPPRPGNAGGGLAVSGVRRQPVAQRARIVYTAGFSAGFAE